jgi:hypothetical protein
MAPPMVDAATAPLANGDARQTAWKRLTIKLPMFMLPTYVLH